MKKLLTLAGIILAFNAHAQLSSGRIAHWTFDGNTNDITGNGHNGTATNITYGSGKSGNPNTAAIFNGTSSYVTVLHQSDLNVTDYSIALIIKPVGLNTATCQGNMIFQRSSPSAGGCYGLLYTDNPYNDCSAVDTTKYVFTASPTANAPSDFQYSPQIVKNTWYAVVVTHRNDTLRTYVNGKLKSTYRTITPVGTAVADLYMGVHFPGMTSGYPYWLNAYLDDLRLYNRVLTDVEICEYSGGIPPQNVIATGNTLCTGDTLKLTGSTTSTSVNYKWTGPSNFASTSASPSVPFATTAMGGIYTLRVTNDSDVCYSIDTALVNVLPGPAKPVITTNAPVCEGQTLTLSASALPNVTYAWTGPGSYTSTSQNITRTSATTAMSGNYIVAATSTANGCKNYDTINAIVKPLPANVAAGNNGPICAGSILSITGSSSSTNVTWSWTGPNGFTSSLQSPAIGGATVAASGTYTLVANLNGCTATTNTTATVHPIPAQPTAGANTPVCTGQTLNLTATTVSGASYIWTGPGTFSSTAQNPTITSATSAMAGTYTVRSSANSCQSAPSSVVVTVVTAPTVFAYPSPKDSICEGKTITFTASITGVTSPSYQWYKNSSIIPGATSNKYATNALVDFDTFYCGVNLTGFCSSPYIANSQPIIVRVLPYMAPLVSITSAPAPGTTVPSGTMINFTATPVNAGNSPGYQWMRNGKNIIGATSNIWGASTLSNHDTICLKMTSGYLCPDPIEAISNCIVVNIESTGISNTGNNNQLLVFPNPSKGEFTLQGKWNGHVRAAITNAVGQIVFIQDLPVNNGTLNSVLNVKTVAAGIYTLRLYNETEQAVIKLTIE